MIKIENIEITGWEAAIRGMRNPYDSWDKSDSKFECGGCNRNCFCFKIGDNDLKLMKSLVRGGDCHAKFARYIVCTFDLTAPLFFWKQWDTYKVGTVSDSCSTMHTLMKRELTIDDFEVDGTDPVAMGMMEEYLKNINTFIQHYKETSDEATERSVFCMLPDGFKQRRTVQVNYQVMRHMYFDRRHHKLLEWLDFCDFIKTLPYAAELITVEGNK